MFPGPTGTNAVEAALKLARKVTGRTGVIAFTNAFHGMTLGSLALTGNASKRAGAGLPLANVSRMPFDGFLGTDVDTMDVIEAYLSDPSSGVDAPAAFVVETIQGEGGINVASPRWLQRLALLARRLGSLLIVDDIQMGCGRTGKFFSFEDAELRPDLVCLSKSLSGYGLPLSLLLIHPDLDTWSPGEHNGTFRGHNLAFVTATAAIELFWRDQGLMNELSVKSTVVEHRLDAMAERAGGRRRGRGFVHGVEFADPTMAGAVSKAAFERGLIIETSGSHDQVIKFLAPLTIGEAQLAYGLEVLDEAVEACSHVDGASDRARRSTRRADIITSAEVQQ
jgi:diaminobutyrate-2-oxoglutarate transaminase